MQFKELEKKQEEKDVVEKSDSLKYNDKKTEENIADLDAIIKEIDARIKEIEKEEEEYNKKEEKFSLDIDSLTNKINAKLDKMDKIGEDDLDKTLYDLSAISDAINATIRDIELKRKKKKQQKARYCDMARKRANMQNRCCNKK